MATFDATVGGSAATSTTTVETADAWLSVRVPAAGAAWTGATTTEKQDALMQATALLEREAWVGVPATPTQALAWPRVGLDAVGGALDGAVIPAGVQRAAAELAYLLLVAPGVDPAAPAVGVFAALPDVKSLDVGGVKLDRLTSGAVGGVVPGASLPAVVRVLVAAYLRPAAALAPTVGTLAAVRSA